MAFLGTTERGHCGELAIVGRQLGCHMTPVFLFQATIFLYFLVLCPSLILYDKNISIKCNLRQNVKKTKQQRLTMIAACTEAYQFPFYAQLKTIGCPLFHNLIIDKNNGIKTCTRIIFRHSISIKFHEFHKLLIQLSVIESLLGQFRQALQAVAERLKQE